MDCKVVLFGLPEEFNVSIDGKEVSPDWENKYYMNVDEGQHVLKIVKKNSIKDLLPCCISTKKNKYNENVPAFCRVKYYLYGINYTAIFHVSKKHSSAIIEFKTILEHFFNYAGGSSIKLNLEIIKSRGIIIENVKCFWLNLKETIMFCLANFLVQLFSYIIVLILPMYILVECIYNPELIPAKPGIANKYTAFIFAIIILVIFAVFVSNSFRFLKELKSLIKRNHK